MDVPIDIMIKRILEQMQKEMQMSEEEKLYWRDEIRSRLEKEWAENDRIGTE